MIAVATYENPMIVDAVPALGAQAVLPEAVWEPDAVTDVETVQKIYFVGGLWISTQIETETRTLLLWDIVNLPKGKPLQIRQDYFGRRVCVANTQRCWAASRN